MFIFQKIKQVASFSIFNRMCFLHSLRKRSLTQDTEKLERDLHPQCSTVLATWIVHGTFNWINFKLFTFQVVSLSIVSKLRSLT